MRVQSFWPLFLTLSTVLFNEFLIFYLKIGLTCSWPEVPEEKDDVLRVFMIADTHILGHYRGHWLDKMKREWQMRQSFTAAVFSLKPEAVFFLGDLLDEGKWVYEEMFKKYSDQFKQLFQAPNDVEVHVLAGNHDLGFHYELDPISVKFFHSNFNKSLVDLVTIKETNFVLLNSMAFEGDGCHMCRDAERQVEKLAERLREEKNAAPPIILQHYPLFRLNEVECLRDAEFDHYAYKRDEKYRPKWESLSQEATRKLLKEFEPRAVFNGHAHRGCKKRWTRPVAFWEYTVNSFSHRNGDRPTLLLASISTSSVAVSTCFLPNESTTITLYILTAFILSLWLVKLLITLFRSLRRRRRGSSPCFPNSTLLSSKTGNKSD